ncbi:hypothetical protein Tco_1542089, partial [Tanacetum coccineum]
MLQCPNDDEKDTSVVDGSMQPSFDTADSSQALVQIWDLVTHGQNGTATHSHIYVAK